MPTKTLSNLIPKWVREYIKKKREMQLKRFRKRLNEEVNNESFFFTAEKRRRSHLSRKRNRV
jgi:hypothetical protein